jgi:hypothetical protein
MRDLGANRSQTAARQALVATMIAQDLGQDRFGTSTKRTGPTGPPAPAAKDLKPAHGEGYVLRDGSPTWASVNQGLNDMVRQALGNTTMGMAMRLSDKVFSDDIRGLAGVLGVQGTPQGNAYKAPAGTPGTGMDPARQAALAGRSAPTVGRRNGSNSRTR